MNNKELIKKALDIGWASRNWDYIDYALTVWERGEERANELFPQRIIDQAKVDQ